MIRTFMETLRLSSPHVCPSPYVTRGLPSHIVPAQGTGTGDWASAYKQAKAFVGKLTQAEKISLTAGVYVDNRCSGNIPPITRLGFPGFCVSDAGNGLVRKEFLCLEPY